MKPANDNISPTRHAGKVLRHVLKDHPHARVLIETGLVYARARDTDAMNATLAIVEAEALATRVLREGEDLTTVGLALGPYKTEIQARAWAADGLLRALMLLQWHPRRIEIEAMRIDSERGATI